MHKTVYNVIPTSHIKTIEDIRFRKVQMANSKKKSKPRIYKGTKANSTNFDYGTNVTVPDLCLEDYLNERNIQLAEIIL